MFEYVLSMFGSCFEHALIILIFYINFLDIVHYPITLPKNISLKVEKSKNIFVWFPENNPKKNHMTALVIETTIYDTNNNLKPKLICCTKYTVTVNVSFTLF